MDSGRHGGHQRIYDGNAAAVSWATRQPAGFRLDPGPSGPVKGGKLRVDLIASYSPDYEPLPGSSPTARQSTRCWLRQVGAGRGPGLSHGTGVPRKGLLANPRILLRHLSHRLPDRVPQSTLPGVRPPAALRPDQPHSKPRPEVSGWNPQFRGRRHSHRGAVAWRSRSLHFPSGLALPCGSRAAHEGLADGKCWR